MAKKVSIIDKKYNDGSTCTQSYRVEYKKTTDTSYSVTEPQFSSPIVIDNLEDDTAYNVRITRTCCNGVAADPELITINTTQTGITSDITIDDTTTTTVEMSWTAGVVVPIADTFILERATVSDYSDATVIYTGALLTYTDTGLTSGTTYYYRLRGYKSPYLASQAVTESATTL